MKEKTGKEKTILTGLLYPNIHRTKQLVKRIKKMAVKNSFSEGIIYFMYNNY